MTGLNVSGTIQLRVFRQNNKLEVTYDKKVNITYGCSSSAFASALNQFDGFKNYQISVIRKIYDINNNILSDTNGANKIDYEVSIYKLRSSSLQA